MARTRREEPKATRPNEFAHMTKEAALARQRRKCAGCRTHIFALGEGGRTQHQYGEGAQAHHMRAVQWGGSSEAGNCVILCQSCHYSAHEGGNYRYSAVVGTPADYPHYNG